MEKAFGPVVIGEWSLATDNCAMWLNGFNDNLPGFPRLPCKYVPCADPYMGKDQPGTPVDPGKPAQGPFGTGMSGPIFGLCPVGRDWLVEMERDSGKDWIRAPPIAPPGRDASDEVMTNLALKKINSFSGYGHGFYFWNFRTDLDEPHWSYMAALERGWIPNGNLNDDAITNACHKEDNGLYKCVARRDQLDDNIRSGIGFVIQADGNYSITEDGSIVTKAIVANMTGDELYDLADRAYNEYWTKHRVEGITCDFGGTAQLIEVNITYVNNDDDIMGPTNSANEQRNMFAFLAFLVFGIVVGTIIGFCSAYRRNTNFRQAVTSTRLGKSIARNKFIHKSFGGFSYDDYEPVPPVRLDTFNRK